ncbi:MAG TPA: hypothetical protein P5572_16790 [Phycisphaerae bacterium]|nr:hypothetical protein [Phycisphaerales bacterium]HRX86683.1 hypothetical protein [Phycisphaerae bacterium]
MNNFRQPTSRSWRWTKRTAFALIVAWLGYGAYARLTTPAVTVEQAYARYGPLPGCTGDPEATRAVIEALNAIPPPPAFDEPAPAGTAWPDSGWSGWGSSISPALMRHGPWLPQARPHLRASIRYIHSPEVEDAVGRLHALRGATLGCTDPLSARGGRETGLQAAMSGPNEVFLGRLRCAFEEQDFATAREEAATFLWLTQGLMHSDVTHAYVGASIECELWCEVAHALRAHAVPDEDLPFWQNLVQAPYDEDELIWTMMVAALRIRARCAAATHFAQTGDGNGWYMLSVPRTPGTPARPVVWNLLTLPFNRHAAVDRRLCASFDMLAAAAPRSDASLRAALSACSLQHAPVSILDGDLVHDKYSDMTTGYRLSFVKDCLTARLCFRRGTLIAIALARYWRVHGHYPDELVQLCPAFLPEVPLDPYCTEAVHYARSAQGYALWSCGRDGRNDGGGAPFGSSPSISIDLAIPPPRPSNWNEQPLIALPPLRPDLAIPPSALEDPL